MLWEHLNVLGMSECSGNVGMFIHVRMSECLANMTAILCIDGILCFRNVILGSLCCLLQPVRKIDQKNVILMVALNGIEASIEVVWRIRDCLGLSRMLSEEFLTC